MLTFKLFVTLIGVSFFIATSLAAAVAETNNVGRFNFTSGQEQVEIPFYTFNNQVILSIMVNDRVPLNFILDSGTSQAILFDRKLALALDIRLGRKVQFSGVGNSNNVIAYRSMGVRLELPGVVGNRMGMAVLNRDYMDMKRFDIHGVIGYQLFARFAVKIDYYRRILTLMEPHQNTYSGFHTFDLAIEDSKPYINSDIRFGNKAEIPLTLMIDTGAAYGLSLITGTRKAVPLQNKNKKTRIASGLGGDITGTKGLVTLTFSQVISAEVVTFFIQSQDYSLKGVDPHKDGSVGCQFLRDYVVILDYVNSKVSFQPQNQAAESLNNKI